MHIREYDADHHVAQVTEILNHWNVVPTSVEAMRRSEWLVPAGSRRVVGFGPAGPEGGPGSFFAQIYVDRDHRRQGVGRLLYAEALRFITEKGGSQIKSQVRDDDPESLSWAKRPLKD